MATTNIILKQRRLETVMEKIARTYSMNFNIKIIPQGRGYKTDGKNIYIPNLNYTEDIPENIKKYTETYILHEIAHLKFTDMNVLGNIFKEKEVIRGSARQLIQNAIEDVYVERKLVEEYPGIKEKQIELFLWMLNSDTTNFIETEKYPLYRNFMGMIYIMANCSSYKVKYDVMPLLDESLKMLYKDIDKTFVERILKCDSTKDCCDIAFEIYDKYFKKDEEKEKIEEHPDDKIKESKEIECIDATEEDGDDFDLEKIKSDIDEKESEEESSLKEDGGISLSESEIDTIDEHSKAEKEFAELMKDPSISKEDKIKIMKDKLARDEEEELLKDDKEKTSFEYKEEKLNKLLSSISTSDRIYFPHPLCKKYDQMEKLKNCESSIMYSDLKKEAESAVSFLRNRIKNVLLTNTLKRWLPDQPEGRLNFNHLYKLKLGSDKVYKKRYQMAAIDTAIEILVDNSGSMSGGKIDMAIKCTIVLGETLSLCNIPYEMLGFTSTNYQIKEITSVTPSSEMYIYTRKNKLITKIIKGWDEQYNQCKLRIPTMSEELHENCDHESILIGARRLAARKEKRKILIVISDGSPANGSECNLNLLQEELVKTINKIEDGGIECIGVGMLTTAPQKFYRKNVIVNELNDFPKELFKLLQKILFKNLLNNK